MIKGVGIDIIEIERFECLIEKYGERFLRRIFTAKEIEYASKRKNAESFAGMFAAKEAFIKAYEGKKPEFIEIEIIHDQHNKPNYHITFANDDLFSLSISHDKTHAVAICIME